MWRQGLVTHNKNISEWTLYYKLSVSAYLYTLIYFKRESFDVQLA